VQPARLEFGRALSAPVESALKELPRSSVPLSSLKIPRNTANFKRRPSGRDHASRCHWIRNTLRSDDGIGQRVAQRVARLSRSKEILVMVRQVLTPDLAGDIVGFDRVVFIDASASELPGSIREQWLTPPNTASSSMVHSLEPADLLGWCMKAYGMLPRRSCSQSGLYIRNRDTLSPGIRQLMRRLVTRALELASYSMILNSKMTCRRSVSCSSEYKTKMLECIFASDMTMRKVY